MAVFNCNNTDLHEGSTGEKVRTLQTYLQKLGYYLRSGNYKLVVDGKYATYTKKAVQQFQSDYKLTSDGWFGPVTCRKFNQVVESKNITTTSSSTPSTSSASATSSKKSNILNPSVSVFDSKKHPSYILEVYNEFVVLPEVEGETVTPTGSTDSDTSFNCDTVSIKQGSSGDEVKKLQNILKTRGYYKASVDGQCGTKTVNAIKQLQKAQGNTADGWFGPVTCRKLQTTTTATNNTTNASAKKTNTALTLTDFPETPSYNIDAEGLTEDLTIKTWYSKETLYKIQRLQKTLFKTIIDKTVVYSFEGYINEISINNENNTNTIQLSICGYEAFLEQQISIEQTAKKSVLLKELIENRAGLELELDLTGLPDDEFTLKSVQETSSGSGLTTMNGNDCTDTYSISARSFDIDECKANTKIGNSSANYAKDTAGMSGKEAILDVYNRFHYGPSLSSSAVYYNNRRCPQAMWTKTGKFWGNCADISRLVKAVGEVHGMKIGIRHMPDHYYNLIEVDGKTYRFDCCCKVSGAYNGETTNNLNKHGGPWS